MPKYRYTARDDRGNAVNGTLAAANPEALADQLKRMGYLITRFREQAEGRALALSLDQWRRVGFDDLALFNVQLAKMVQVGIPLVSALQTLSQQTENPRLRGVMGDVARQVESGTSFSEALAQHRAVFSELFVSMVHAGEVSGKLDEILQRLAVFAKHQAELRQQLKTAMTYPVVLIIASIGVAALLLVGIIPKFMKIFFEAGVPLPLPTMLLHQLSEILLHDGVVVAAGAGLGLFGVTRWLKSASGRRWLDTVILRLPIIGDLARKAAISRLARTLVTLLTSGVPVLEALSIAERTCGNAVLADAMRDAGANVKKGGVMSEPIQASRQFPPMVVQMVAVGESSGTLDHMLGEIADHYDELVQYGIKRVTALIEPVFLVLIGGMVAFIMASILLPLFRMVNVIG